MSMRLQTYAGVIFGLALVLLSGCEQNSMTSGPIFFEFRQQPGDKYHYTVHDEVNWRLEFDDGKTKSYQRWQLQKSVMKFNSIDSNAVRDIDLNFTVVFDSFATEMPWMKGNPSREGHCYDLKLQMRPNGDILTVESADPRLTFFFNSGYRPSQLVFPAKAVAVGDSWQHSTMVPVPSGEPAQVKSHYTFEGIERIGDFDCAVILFEAAIEFQEVMEENAENKSEEYDYRTYNCRTTSAGRLYFAFREGFVLKKTNMLNSNANSCQVTNGESRINSQTKMQDAEKIILTQITRSTGEIVKFEIE